MHSKKKKKKREGKTRYLSDAHFIRTLQEIGGPQAKISVSAQQRSNLLYNFFIEHHGHNTIKLLNLAWSNVDASTCTEVDRLLAFLFSQTKPSTWSEKLFNLLMIVTKTLTLAPEKHKMCLQWLCQNFADLPLKITASLFERNVILTPEWRDLLKLAKLKSTSLRQPKCTEKHASDSASVATQNDNQARHSLQKYAGEIASSLIDQGMNEANFHPTMQVIVAVLCLCLPMKHIPVTKIRACLAQITRSESEHLLVVSLDIITYF